MEKENFISLGICFSCGVKTEGGKDTMKWNTRARLDKALSLYRSGFVNKILCSGGVFQAGQTVPIAEIMKEYLIDRNVPAEDILTESESVDTMENIKFSFSLLDRMDFFKKLTSKEQLRLVLVSEALHLKRIEVTVLAYLEQYGLKEKVPIILEPVHYSLSEESKELESKVYEETLKDPFGDGEFFEKVRRGRRQK